MNDCLEKLTYIAYFRVSTSKQERSGLGLESQREIVRQFATQSGAHVIDEYIEIESGGKNNRPQLRQALKAARLKNSTLLIAKLDRLSRNVAFLANMMESNVKFVCCDNPQANEMTIHILAAVAQQERKLISERTKAALAAKKSQGFKLGNPNLHLVRNNDTKAATQAVQAGAAQWLDDIRDAVTQFDHLSLTRCAKALNTLGFKTRRNSCWSATQVKRIRDKLRDRTAA